MKQFREQGGSGAACPVLRLIKPSCLFVLVAFLAGCYTPPVMTDSLSNLGPVSKDQSRKVEPRSLLNRKVALILSDNTRKWIAEYKTQNESAIKSWFGISGETTNLWSTATDPQLMAAGPLLHLKKYFREIVLANDFGAGRSAGAAMAVVLDMQSNAEITRHVGLSDGAVDHEWRIQFQFVDLSSPNPALVFAADGYSMLKACPIDAGGPFNPNPTIQSFHRCDQSSRTSALESLNQNLRKAFGG